MCATAATFLVNVVPPPAMFLPSGVFFLDRNRFTSRFTIADTFRPMYTRQLRNARDRGVFEVGSFSRGAFIDRRESARTVTRDNVTEEFASISDESVFQICLRGLLSLLVGKADGRGFREG